jgi:hypothetical protein
MTVHRADARAIPRAGAPAGWADTRAVPMGVRLLAVGCVAALPLVAPTAMAMPPGMPSHVTAAGTGAGTAAPSGRPQLSFIEALAAVPEATRSLAAARQELGQARARQAGIRLFARTSHRTLATAAATLQEASAALARADHAASAAQDAVDDAARTMYASGGAVPSLVDVLLTAESEGGLTSSLLTREYLASVGAQLVRDMGQAQQARALAAGDVLSAGNQRDVALSVARSADATLAGATHDVAATQAAVDDARSEYRSLMTLTRVDRSADYGRIRRCGDRLTRLLSRTGFEGENLREAWAIVMRESGGRPDAVSATDDLGLFQINTDTWQDEAWFDRDLLLTRKYNAKVALQLSRGGHSWYSWGLDGHGRPEPAAYVKAGWSDERITSHIVVPYVQWYAQYPCRPAYEKDSPYPVPTLPPNSDEGLPSLVARN